MTDETSLRLGLDKVPLEKLVENAHEEVNQLCHGKRWRMCVPVQADDSDIVITEALRAQASEIERLKSDLAVAKDSLDGFAHFTIESNAETASLKASCDALRQENERLLALLRQCEWLFDGIADACPICAGEEPNHKPDCGLQAALKGDKQDG